MNRLLFQTADFLSRPPGFYFLMLAMAACTAVVPFGWTNAVTYALSVLAIVITGWCLSRGIATRLPSMRSWTRSSSRLVRPAMMWLAWSMPIPTKSRACSSVSNARPKTWLVRQKDRLLPRADRRVVKSEIAGHGSRRLYHGPLERTARISAWAVRRWGPWPIQWMEKILLTMEEAVSRRARQTLLTHFIPDRPARVPKMGTLLSPG